MADSETWETKLLQRCERYQYNRLDRSAKTIRLFKVLNRGIFQDGIFIKEMLEKERRDPSLRRANEQLLCPFIAIQEFPLETAPDFSTLSYCWGDESAEQRPVFTSHEWSQATSANPSAKLWISENLYRAIRQIVIPVLGHDGWWWADAICINQEDDDEKTWQVNLMWHIYNRSKQTLCWLGEGVDGEDDVIDSLFYYWNEWRQGPNAGGDHIDWELPEDINLPALKKLIEFPYWGRAWVQQEVNAQGFDDIWIMCGRKKTHIKMLVLLVEGVINRVRSILELTQGGGDDFRTEWERDLITLQNSKSFARMDRLMRSSPVGNMRYVYILHQWLRLIYLHGQGVLAKDGRDLIFALYSMSREREADLYQADYLQSCREVYIELAKTFSQIGWSSVLLYRNDPSDRYKDEKIFQHLEASEVNQLAMARPRSLPSWVPNWRQPIKPVHFLNLPSYRGSTEHQYSAGKRSLHTTGGNESQSLFRYAGDKMIASAVSVGKVTWISQSLSIREGLSRLQIVQEWLESLDVATSHATRTNSQAQSPHIWQIPILDAEIAPQLELRRATDISAGAYDTLKWMWLESAQANEAALSPEIDRYCEVALAACEGKKLFVSDSGRIGICFAAVEIGDLVTVIEGVDVPMLLRHASSEDFTVISDAFVDGIMYGEIWRSNPATQDIRLR